MDQLAPYITQFLVLLITVVLGYCGVNVTQQAKAQTNTQQAGLTLAQQQAATDFLHRVVPMAVRSAEQLFGMTPGQGALKERYVRDTVKALVGDTVDPLELTTLIQAAVLALPSVLKSQISVAEVPLVAGVTPLAPLLPAPPATQPAPAEPDKPPMAVSAIYTPPGLPTQPPSSNGTAGDAAAEPVATGG